MIQKGNLYTLFATYLCKETSYIPWAPRHTLPTAVAMKEINGESINVYKYDFIAEYTQWFPHLMHGTPQ